jgi:hypothetical protein
MSTKFTSPVSFFLGKGKAEWLNKQINNYNSAIFTQGTEENSRNMATPANT